MNVYPTTVSLINENISLGTYDLGLSGNNEAKGFDVLVDALKDGKVQRNVYSTKL